MAQTEHSLWWHDKQFLQTLEPRQARFGLVGIDEAGRGALAGPVHAAAFWLSGETYHAKGLDMRLRQIADSKAMRAAQREVAAEALHALAADKCCAFAVASASVEEINRLNILGATRLAMSRAVEQLQASTKLFFDKTETVDLPLLSADTPEQAESAGVALLVDGRPLRPFEWQHRALVGGDALSLVIAAASVLAKVTRDRYMRTLDQCYPHYGFGTHAGYGTRSHRQAILDHGPSPEHRPLFLRKVLAALHSAGPDA
jgi:ribonuclease HII